LGQSFLEDTNVMNKIIRTAVIQENDIIVEIGAGLGLMTDLMAATARRVIALDVDPFMITILTERLGERPHVDIVHTDVLKYDFSTPCTAYGSEKIKIVGNIPYNISSQILFRLLAFRHCISSAVLLVQKEVADRLTALAGTKEYGIPSVVISMFAKVSHEFNVSSSCFYPEPKVTSTVLKMTFRDRPLIELRDEDLFRKVVKIAFSKRRKTLLNTFRHANLPEYRESDLIAAFAAAGIDGRRRGETLLPEEFGILSNGLSSHDIS
jgi:16S rRNA (adenine1518-N6/adenine1519-N6)-dimethyltransferase